MTDAAVSPFETWMLRPPAFLAHVSGDVMVASGIQIDPLHVVTCAHVLGRKPETFDEQEQRADVTRRVAAVQFGSFETQGTVIAQHDFLDLVLLRLAKPRPGVAVPALFEEGYKGPVCVTGVRRTGETFETLLHRVEITTEGSSRGGVLTQVKYNFGAREGSSGGGVFALQDEKLSLVGITTIGGEFSIMGGYIPAQAVLFFLKEKLGFENPRPLSLSAARDLLSSGIAPTWQVAVGDSQLALSFVAIPNKAAGAPARTCFVSRRVISASEMRFQTQHRTRPGHRRLPARADSIEQAEVAIQRLESNVGLKLRLPTSAELQASWQAAVAANTPEGRPLTLSDFTPNELGFEVPPVGTIEWARDRSGLPTGVERCHYEDGLRGRRIPPDQARVREPCFRVAFDVEGL